MADNHLPQDAGQCRNRRNFERLACSRFACSCSIKPEFGDDLRLENNRGGVLLSNVSTDGISFETNLNLERDDDLLLEIRPIEGPELSAKIKVLHSRLSEKHGFFVVGSQFKDIGENDRQNLLFLIDTIQRMENNLCHYHDHPKSTDAFNGTELQPM